MERAEVAAETAAAVESGRQAVDMTEAVQMVELLLIAAVPQLYLLELAGV